MRNCLVSGSKTGFEAKTSLLICYAFVNDTQGDRKVALTHTNRDAVHLEASQKSASLSTRHNVHLPSLLHHPAWLHSQPSLSTHQMMSRRLSGSFNRTQNPGWYLSSVSAKQQVTHRKKQSVGCINMLPYPGSPHEARALRRQL